eukprot:Rhum_TRINITY_DN14032_c0_g1::Rhum_TRINITY_DN14032_c0_g1_i3::g.67679::m.67679
MAHACLDRATACIDLWASAEGDTSVQKVTKRLFTVGLAATCLAYSLALVAARDRGSQLGQLVMSVVLCIALPFLLYLRAVRRASAHFVAAVSYFMLVSLIASDIIHAAEPNRRPWPLAVVLIDILLVAQAKESVAIVIVVSMCVYLAVTQLEEFLRFGMYDLPGLAPYETRSCQGGCERPPCPRSGSMSLSILVGNIVMILLDFYFTRGFALQVRREQEKIAAAVAATEQVAERLASLDLDAAEAVLQGSEDVPPGLCESLQTILSHLRCYKPFLPQAVML